MFIRDRFEAALQKLRTLYGGKPGVELEETPDQAVYRWQEEADGNSVLKTMTIRWEAPAEAGNWKLVRNLEEIWEFPASGEAGDVMTRMLDLNDYARGEMIDISVRAIAADQAAVYRDGPEGVVRTMTLPSRLDVPDVEELTGLSLIHIWINTGTLSGCQAGGPGKELSLVSNGTDVSLGGMAGSNSGSISGTAAEYLSLIHI